MDNTIANRVLTSDTSDRTLPPEASRTFMQSVASPDKELHEYPGAYTNLLSDTAYEKVLTDIDSWLAAHV